MRILQVSWEYPPLVYGGLGRHVHGLAEAQVRAGHEVVVLSQEPPPATRKRRSAAEETQRGVLVVRAASGPPTLSMTDDLVAWTQVLQSSMVRAGLDLLKTWRPDVVHAHDWVTAHAGVALAGAAGVPLVATIHATEAGLWNGWIVNTLSLARHEVECWLVRQASHVIVCSRHMRDEVSRALGVAPDELIVTSNGVEVDQWRATYEQRHAARVRVGARPGVPMIVQAGRLEWEKGGHVALAALARIREDHPTARLVFAGTGSQEEELRALARRRRLVRAVDFTGKLTQPDLAALLGAADVVLVPSAYEPFGMAALEAMAAGRPVVASGTGGLADIIHHKTSGLLVPPQDDEALAAAVSGLLADPARAARLGKAARRRVREQFTWTQVATQTAAVYEGAVRVPRAPRPSLAPPSYGNVFPPEARPAAPKPEATPPKGGAGRTELDAVARQVSGIARRVVRARGT